jgi:multidrug efflux pump subunit AcrA (membrane-fusion protein)
LNQARAALESARLNLSHTVITSPISGTIISRNVDRGQTVAASFSSPTLFEIGEDLTKMRVNTSIDEADVAKLRVGMSATFTVDAYPEEAFEGRLNQIRLAASTVQNVVTYDAIIDVSNPQLRLKPGMTANVKILIQTEKNVLKLPNAALRFKPVLSEIELESAYQRAREEEYYRSSKLSHDGSHTAGDSADEGRPVQVALPVSTDSWNPGGNDGAGSSREAIVWILDENNCFIPC